MEDITLGRGSHLVSNFYVMILTDLSRLYFCCFFLPLFSTIPYMAIVEKIYAWTLILFSFFFSLI